MHRRKINIYHTYEITIITYLESKLKSPKALESPLSEFFPLVSGLQIIKICKDQQHKI